MPRRWQSLATLQHFMPQTYFLLFPVAEFSEGDFLHHRKRVLRTILLLWNVRSVKFCLLYKNSLEEIIFSLTQNDFSH